MVSGKFRKEDLPSDFTSLPPETQEAVEHMAGSLSVGVCHADLEQAWTSEEAMRVMLLEAGEE